MDLDAALCRELLFDVLPNLSLLDPACGSGAFLVAAMKTLINIYAAVVGKIKFLGQKNLTDWLAKAEREHKSLNYFIKKRIITDNLYGVDIMEEATEIARLRLFLALVASATDLDQLEPLPNIDFNILPGNSLVGLMRVNDQDFEKRTAQNSLFRRSYAEVLAEKNRLIETYRHAATFSQHLASLRNDIQKKKDESLATLNDILLGEFNRLGIKFEQAVWDKDEEALGKPKKRNITYKDIEELQPFHWGFEFDKVLQERGGFDAIITNPPWEIFKPNSKEFFQEYSALVTKKNMSIHEFEEEQAKLLTDEDIRKTWLLYLSGFPHVSAYYRSAPQYKNQISIVNGKKAGSDINLYKLFLELCFDLLRTGGRCGIITSGGVYSDLGAKQLREMLFSGCKLDSLFGLTNERYIFENVDHRQKFCLLVFEKGGTVDSFTAAFRINPREAIAPDELDMFLNSNNEHTRISIDLVRRLSPDSLSVMEFRNEMDVRIAEKMAHFPMLGQRIGGTWNIELGNEFHMTGDSDLFKTSPGRSRLPLYEGKMIWQFDHRFAAPRYWVDESEGRQRIVGRTPDTGELLGYQEYRLGHRSVASSTNTRTMIATIIPTRVFFGHSINATRSTMRPSHLLFATSLLNSFVVDFALRSSVSQNLTMFFVYQLPVPRLSEADTGFKPIVERAARLICTTPEFNDLAKGVGLGNHKAGATDPAERARLRAELDGLVAHLYGLTEEEFAHILATFPVVEASVKDAALAAYKAFAPKSADQEVAAMIAGGESATVEFKSSARWDLKQNTQNKAMEQVIVKTVAAFLNTDGGTLLIGIDDSGTVLGLENDYKTLGKRQDRAGYENWLMTLLLDQFGKESSPLVRITFHDMAGQDVSRVAVKPSPKAAYVTEGVAENLYIRTGNATRQLTTKEAIEYSKHRWK
jgi:hypothetical protein